MIVSIRVVIVPRFSVEEEGRLVHYCRTPEANSIFELVPCDKQYNAQQDEIGS